MWGGTSIGRLLLGVVCFYIHPPRVGRDQRASISINIAKISIHPPRVGRDPFPLSPPASNYTFQSTLPVWGGTKAPKDQRNDFGFQSTLPVWGGTGVGFAPHGLRDISIHPPRVGRDSSFFIFLFFGCGFQSTLPVWGGTTQLELPETSKGISIHPPRVGRDYRTIIRIGNNFRFQSTLPVWGGTRWQRFNPPCRFYFNPPSPCGEGQQKLTKILCKLLR